MIGTLWQHTAAPQPRRRSLAEFTAAELADLDVCIIGGGLTGLWTAYHLLRADPGLRVLVLEAAQVGFGASGRNGGWCSALFPVSTAGLIARHGREPTVALRSACRAAVDDVLRIAETERLEIDAAKGGTIVLARSAAGSRSAAAEVAETERLGIDRLELLSPQQSAAHVRAHGVRAATFTPDCARLHPLRLVQGLAERVEGLGGLIAEHTRVTGYHPGTVQVSSPAGAELHCRSVIRATEGFTPWLGGADQRTVVPVYSLVLATPVLPQSVWDEIGLDRGETFSEQQHLVVYGQRTADDRLVFGGRGAPYHWGSAVAPRFDRVSAVHRGLARHLVSLFPPLAGRPARARIESLPVEFTWGGALGIPRDWHPSVRYDPRTGLGSAGGYVGDGVALTQLAGATLADLIGGRDTERTRLPWVGHRSPDWEPEPLRWLGVNAGLQLAKGADLQERVTGRPGLLGRALAGLTGGP